MPSFFHNRTFREDGLARWEVFGLLFSVGWSVMAIQLLSSRFIAPYFGASLYSWTSVIGTTLFGMVFGAMAGGRLAERFSSRRFLGKTIFIAACTVLLVNQLAPAFGALFLGISLPLWAKTVFFSLLSFAPSALLLSSLTPQVIKLATTIDNRAGRQLGSFWATSGFGNVVGATLTNPWLVPILGMMHVVVIIAILLFAWSIWLCLPLSSAPSRTVAIAVAFLLFGNLLAPSFCQRESRYYCIRIVQKTSPEGLPSFVLRLDHLVHSSVTPQLPERLGYAYESVYANLVASRFSEQQPFSALFIGGGGYVMPRYLFANYPQATSTVAEIDPAVTEINHSELGLPYHPRIQTVDADARRFLLQASSTKYDLVFGDAFNDFGVPVHLTTLEFHQLLKQHMTPDGVYALNIIDDPRHGRFLAAMIRTLRAVWTTVEVAPQQTSLEPGKRNTIVLLASDRPIVSSTWLTTDSPAHRYRVERQEEVTSMRELTILATSTVERFLQTVQAPILTDELAPIDRYLAPVFRDSQ